MRIPSVAALLAAVALAVTGCGAQEGGTDKDTPPSRFAVLADAPIATSNAATAWGDAVGAAQLASRVFPALYVPGPAGQMVPNSDLADADFRFPPSTDGGSDGGGMRAP